MTVGGWFEYKGINSKDFHLMIENSISFPSPEADIEFIEVLGKDGDVAIDNKRLKSVRFPIPVKLKLPDDKTVNQVATAISEWLKTDVGYSPLKFSGQPGYHYIAILNEQFDIAETLKTYGRTVLVFRLQPIKYSDNNRLHEIANGVNLVNPHSKIAKPYIKVTGNGNIVFKKNGIDWIRLNGVDGYIEIDSEPKVVYKDELMQGLKMESTLSPMFPELDAGENVITWTGNVSKVEINEKWGTVV